MKTIFNVLSHSLRTSFLSLFPAVTCRFTPGARSALLVIDWTSWHSKASER